MEQTIMSHYTVGYHDNYNGLHEICEYADDAYHAIKQAEEDLRVTTLHTKQNTVLKRTNERTTSNISMCHLRIDCMHYNHSSTSCLGLNI